MKWWFLALVACTPSYWRGPGTRAVEEERVQLGAKLNVSVSWKMPARPDEPRPEWLGAPGEAWSEELARDFAPGAFHNGHLPAIRRFDLVVDHHGTLELSTCPSIVLISRTSAQIEADIAACAARYVDEPFARVQIAENPAWSVVVIVNGVSKRSYLQPGMTLIQLVALEGGVKGRRVLLGVSRQPPRRIDVESITFGTAPDIPLRLGDTVVFE